MTRLIISTNQRAVVHGEVSGWLYVVDLDTLKILTTTAGIEPPGRIHDINPRGGMRGMRGIGICNGELAVANYSGVFFFDFHWKLCRVFSHPLVSGIHEILYVEDGLWVTSSYNDVLLKFDLIGNVEEFFYARSKSIMKLLGGRSRQLVQPENVQYSRVDFRDRTKFNMNFYDGTHLNAICRAPDGHLYLSLGLVTSEKFAILQDIKSWMVHAGLWNIFVSVNRLFRKISGAPKQMFSDLIVQPAKGNSAIISMMPHEQPMVFLTLPEVINPSHSIRSLLDGTGIYLNTSRGSVVHFDEQGRILSQTKVADKFLRGAFQLSDRMLVLGNSNTLLFFDLESKRVVKSMDLSDDISNSVFDIKILPDEFDLPPHALESKTGRIVRFDGPKVIWK